MPQQEEIGGLDASLHRLALQDAMRHQSDCLARSPHFPASDDVNRPCKTARRCAHVEVPGRPGSEDCGRRLNALLVAMNEERDAAEEIPDSADERQPIFNNEPVRDDGYIWCNVSGRSLRDENSCVVTLANDPNVARVFEEHGYPAESP